MVQAKIIYSNREIHEILENKAKSGAYYLMFDDIFFEEIEGKRNISREFYLESKKVTRSIDIIKHISFNYKEDYTTKDMFDLLEILRNYAMILIILFNPNKKECDLLFIGNENDFEIERYINDFIELEEM